MPVGSETTRQYYYTKAPPKGSLKDKDKGKALYLGKTVAIVERNADNVLVSNDDNLGFESDTGDLDGDINVFTIRNILNANTNLAFYPNPDSYAVAIRTLDAKDF